MFAMFTLFLFAPYVVGFVALALWRKWWMFGSAAVAMMAVYFHFASRPPADGPGVAFLADFIPLNLGIGIATGSVTSVLAMITNIRSSYVVPVIFVLGCLVWAKSLGFF